MSPNFFECLLITLDVYRREATDPYSIASTSGFWPIQPTSENNFNGRVEGIKGWNALSDYSIGTSGVVLEPSSTINELKRENEAIKGLLEKRKNKTDELRVELEELYDCINAFKARHLSSPHGPHDLTNIFTHFDIRGKYFCHDQRCVFVCTTESKLGQHTAIGIHCHLTVLVDPWSSHQTARLAAPATQAHDADHELELSPEPRIETWKMTVPEIIKASKTELGNLEGQRRVNSSISLQHRREVMEQAMDLGFDIGFMNSEKESPSNLQKNLSSRDIEAEEPAILNGGSGVHTDFTAQASQPGPSFLKGISTFGDHGDDDELLDSLERMNESPARGLKSGREHDNPGSHTIKAKDSKSTKRPRTTKDTTRFKCDQCPKQFTRSSTLREHARTHSNHRPFMCRVCGKSFVRLKDRNRHDALHTGEKKFVCKGGRPMFYEPWGCDRKFAREDALVAHFRNEAGWTCLRPLLTDAEMRDCFFQYADGQDPDGSLQCRKLIVFAGNRFGIKSGPGKSGCEEVFSSRDDLEFHFQTTTGRWCIWGLSVELATLSARQYRENDERGHDILSMDKSQRNPDEGRETAKVQICEPLRPRVQENLSDRVGNSPDTVLTSGNLTPYNGPSSQGKREQLIVARGTETLSETSSTSPPKYRSGWDYAY